jgi:hypothetical protein
MPGPKIGIFSGQLLFRFEKNYAQLVWIPAKAKVGKGPLTLARAGPARVPREEANEVGGNSRRRSVPGAMRWGGFPGLKGRAVNATATPGPWSWTARNCRAE